MKTILMGFGVESRVEKEDSMTEDESRSNFGLAQWTQTRCTLLLDEFSNVVVNFVRFLMDYPMRGVRHALYAQLRNELMEAIEVTRDQRRILVAPNHEGRNSYDHMRGIDGK